MDRKIVDLASSLLFGIDFLEHMIKWQWWNIENIKQIQMNTTRLKTWSNRNRIGCAKNMGTTGPNKTTNINQKYKLKCWRYGARRVARGGGWETGWKGGEGEVGSTPSMSSRVNKCQWGTSRSLSVLATVCTGQHIRHDFPHVTPRVWRNRLDAGQPNADKLLLHVLNECSIVRPFVPSNPQRGKVQP